MSHSSVKLRKNCRGGSLSPWPRYGAEVDFSSVLII
jgi:hypothetical protein